VLKNITVGTAVLLLGGCALPVPLQIASWALDGISVLATQKSVTDHGISIVTDKDCAVWRGVVEGELCREVGDQDVLVAEKKTAPILSAGFAPATEERIPEPSSNRTLTITNQQVVADRRQAGVVFNHAMSNTNAIVVAQRETMTPQAPLPKVVQTKAVELPEPEMEIQSANLVKWSPPAQPEFLDETPAKGIYFVIGSFRNQNNAERLSEKHKRLEATLISAKLDGKKIYRVVVGPIKEKYIKVAHKNLRKEGLADTWAIRVNPSDWTIASPNRKTGGEVARLTE
jgi:hypothetical protein